MNTNYTIGKIAMQSAVSADTLRFYEKKGLITPTLRTAAGYRLYTEDAVYQDEWRFCPGHDTAPR